MQIRPITADEKKTAVKIQSVAFAFTIDPSGEEDDTEKDSYKTCRAAFDENGKICSCLELLPFEVMFNGTVVPMSGIGGVATLPEETGKKYAQKVMAYCIDEMYRDGDVFSYLYPFSHAYYRKFGYELNMRLYNYSFSLDQLSIFKVRKNLKLHVSGDNTDDIKMIYSKFIQDKNLALVRNEDRWSNFFKKDPYKDNVYIYILYNSGNQPAGYVKYSIDKRSIHDKDIVINELIWLDFEALKGIFAFIAGLSPQYKNLKWRAPEFLDLKLLFPEPYHINCEVLTHGMNRIVNVQKCLELLRFPEHSGNIVIEVFDDFLNVNSGKYNLTWESGSLKVSRCSKTADMTCDIQSLSQLVTGFATPKSLYHLKKIDLSSNIEALEKLFTKKELYINDGF